MEAPTQDEAWLTRNTMPLVGCTDEPRSTIHFAPVNDITTIDAYIGSTPVVTHDNTGTDEGGYRDIGTTGSPTTITGCTRVYLMTTPMIFSETSFSLNSQVISVCLAVIGVVLFLISVIASIVFIISSPLATAANTVGSAQANENTSQFTGL
ncbi:hypothetical protein LSAT2_014449 [Lamellibrachia satsuma]|nr:hypothetical protein LSAT2_014449 [Lamellibrachia satsuma]